MNEMPKIEVSIVTVVYNALDEFKCLLASLEEVRYRFFELIVVFNGEGSNYSIIEGWVNSSTVTCKLIKCKNYGFAHGCNIGVNSASYECIWLLNSDCRVEEETILAMLAKYNYRKNAIIGSKILHNDGSVQCFGGGEISFLFGYQKQVNNINSSKIDYITGASLMISKSNYSLIGFMDEEFFLYWEETDFCMKARGLGIEMLVAEDAIVHHSVGASTDINSLFTEYYSTRNSIAFFKRYSSKTQIIVVILTNVIVKTFNRAIRFQFNRIPTILLAIYEGYTGKLGISNRK